MSGHNFDAHHVFLPKFGLRDVDNCFIMGNRTFDIGTKVIKWFEPQGFNSYDTSRSVSHYEDRKTGKPKIIRGRRYSKRRGGIKSISQIMIHHSGGDGYMPRNMYETLHNHRGLSVHYAVDDNGVIWQFLDAQEKAWHGGKHNNCSIGIEGMLYPLADHNPDYYSPERNKRTKNLPHEVVEDRIHGRRGKYFKFTEVQMDAMARLIAGNWLATALFDQARELRAPQFARANGAIPRTVLDKPLKHRGMIGHLQATRRKIDPAGFPWERFEKMVRAYYWEMARGIEPEV